MSGDDAAVETGGIVLGAMAGRKGSKARQILASCTVNLATLTAGCVLGWTSPSLPKLSASDSHLPITPAQGSWIGSLAGLGAAVGPIPAGLLADRVGRRWTMLALALPFVLSWALVAGAQSVGVLYAARVVGGLGVGAVYAVAPVYVGEIAEDSIRGALGSMLNALITVGFLYEYAIGPYVSHLVLALTSLLIPVLFAVTFYFVPETPYYLLARGRHEDAAEALGWLRGASRDEVTAELDMMKESVQQAASNSGSWKDLFATRVSVKAIYLCWGLIVFQQFSGIEAVLFYSTNIFQLSGSALSSDVSTIIVGAVMVLSACCTPLVVERVGRRPLLFASATGMAVAHIVLGLFFFLKDVRGTDLSAVGWLPVLSLVTYIASHSIGFGPLPWAIVGEIMPSNIKSLASASTASLCWMLGFLVTKSFQSIVDSLGVHVAFWSYAVVCLVGNVFVFVLLPETKGMSLDQIQTMLGKK